MFLRSRNYVKDPFSDNFRKVNYTDVPTGFYNGVFVEQRFYRTRRIGSITGFEKW